MITEQEFRRIVSYMKSNYGIDLSHKKTLIAGRLENYLLKNGYNSYDEYMTMVERDTTGEEASNLINILTTNHTYFMREFEQFEFMRRQVLPELKVSLKGSRELRIWSAASSTGEEPYTLAMVLMDFFGLEHSNWDTRVLATDISEKVLRHAMKGCYPAEQIETLPEVWKRRYFKKINEDQYQVKEELRREVIFRKFNLMSPLPFRQKLHIVFIRNVMIYFDEATKRDLVKRIYDCMVPGGYLFVGTTESIDKESAGFKYIMPSVYRK